jgi:hypothetical protein
MRAGARSVSDFARAAVLTEVAAGPSLPILELSHRWTRLEQRLDAILGADASGDLDTVEEAMTSHV